MRAATITIPQPCAESWAAMTPTAAGRHCAACQKTVVDFTRISEADIVAYLAARPKQSVCGIITAPAAIPRQYKRKTTLRRWLLVAAAFFGGHPISALSLAPQRPPVRTDSFWGQVGRATIVIRGVVLDEALNIPVQGTYVFINDTKYGAVTNERGEFTLSFSAEWEPVKSGTIKLRVTGVPFELVAQTVVVRFGGNRSPAPLTVRLLSEPERGRVMGKAFQALPPTAPPRKGRR